MLETLYRMLCASGWRRWLGSVGAGVLVAAISTATWWQFHVPGARRWPLWVYGLILALVSGIPGAVITYLLLWLWYAEHEVMRRCEAYRAQQLTAVLSMSNTVRNALEVISHASWTPKDAELYAMVQESVTRIESELRHLVNDCEHARREPPGHGKL